MVLSGLIDAAVSRRPKSPSSLLDPLRLLDLRLVGGLRLLETCGRVGERLVVLLVFLGLLARAISAFFLRDLGFALGALLLELLRPRDRLPRPSSARPGFRRPLLVVDGLLLRSYVRGLLLFFALLRRAPSSSDFVGPSASLARCGRGARAALRPLARAPVPAAAGSALDRAAQPARAWSPSTARRRRLVAAARRGLRSPDTAASRRRARAAAAVLPGADRYGSTSDGSPCDTPVDPRRMIVGVIMTTSSVCVLLIRAALEQAARAPGCRRCRESSDIVLFSGVVHQPGDRERLAVLQFDFGLGAARRQRRQAEAVEHDRVA